MLRIEHLRKHYGDLVAVNGISFSLQPGDIFGFIGSNGAGKTTTIRMLATLLEPTSGTASINGFDILRDPMGVRRQIGYMPDFFGLYDDVKVWEYLDFFATIYSVPVRERPKVIDSVLELVNLSGKREAFVQSLSRGMQQRLCLARCLVHDPSLLLLDEPASGLDPRARAELKDLISELGRMGKIVIVSSHILPELADFCTTVGIIERGNMLAFGPMNDIIKQFQQVRTLRILVLDSPQRTFEFLAGKPLISNLNIYEDNSIGLEFSGTHEDQSDLLAALVNGGHRVIDFREIHANLEDVFLKVTTGAVN